MRCQHVDLFDAMHCGMQIMRHHLAGIGCAEDPFEQKQGVAESGSPQSHAAIIARSMGIPGIVQAGSAFLAEATAALISSSVESGSLAISSPVAGLKTVENRWLVEVTSLPETAFWMMFILTSLPLWTEHSFSLFDVRPIRAS